VALIPELFSGGGRLPGGALYDAPLEEPHTSFSQDFESKHPRDKGKFAHKAGAHPYKRDDIGPHETVEMYDTNTGEVLWTGPHAEASQMLRESEAAEGVAEGQMEGIGVRRPGEADRQVAGPAQQVAQPQVPKPTHTPAGIPIPEDPRPEQPGGKDWIDPPEKLYHATYAAEEILAGGFRTADELGTQVLGGSKTDSVSFTTKENAEIYRDGLAVARLAARGELPFTPEKLTEIAARFGVTDRATLRAIWRDAATGQMATADDPKKWFNALQRVSMEGRVFPLFMGGNWPPSVRTARPPAILEVNSRGPERYSYNKGETEWRIEDATKITGLRLV
jgi:hypothetical protein